MIFLLITLIAVGVNFTLATNKTNNVCKTFADYYQDMQHNPNCYYNPDIHLSADKIIQRHGYPVETYTATTTDGYILTIFRIPHKKSSSTEKTGQPVFILHGLSLSCMIYLDRGRKSLAFILADNGYDVWIGNFRGTRYSSHQTLTTNDLKYWDYSFDDVGTYDLPALLNVVSNKTTEKLVYIGFSMGNTAYFVYNSKFPEEAAEKIKLSISLAPAAYVDLKTTPFKSLIILLEPWLNNITGGTIRRRTPTSVALMAETCLPDPIKINICSYPMLMKDGFDFAQQDPETLPITFMQNFDSTAVKAFVHYVQVSKSRKFAAFDYGVENTKVYGTSSPPLYNLSAITVPNYLIRANNDQLVSKENVEKLYAMLPEVAKPFKIRLVKYKKFTHLDFIRAKDVKELVYDNIDEVIKAFVANVR